MEGFRSFRQKAVINFPESGLMLVSGKWKDTPTSSGSGKSSIFLGIAFALGYCDRPATSLKNRSSKKMKVRLQVTDGIDTYDIVRDPKLSLFRNGQQLSVTATDAEDKLSQLVKTTPELAQALTYRPQRKPGTFLNKTDADKKEFLANILGLSKLEAVSDDFNNQIKADAMAIEQANKNLAYLNAFVESNQVSQNDLDQAKLAYETALHRYNASVHNSVNPELVETLNAAQEQYRTIQTAKRSIDTAKQKIDSLKQEFMRIRDEVARLKENVCYTCNREWSNTGEAIAQKEQRAKEIFAKVKESEAIISNAQPLVIAEPALLQTIQDLNQKIGGLKAPIQDALSAKNIAEANLRRITESKNSMDKARAEQMKIEVQINAFNQKIKLNQHIVNITGRTGFMADIFDEVLLAIEKRTNDFMASLPNVASYSLQFSSTATTQKGIVKKTISTKLIKDNEEIDVKDVSGGQQCSVELCTDLSVAEEIRARSGSPLGWIALDEAMDGLDIEPKRAALEAIRTNTKGLVIVIDHSTEIKESFDAVVQVEFDGRESYVLN